MGVVVEAFSKILLRCDVLDKFLMVIIIDKLDIK